MRCKACDNDKGVRAFYGDWYCPECRSSIMDTISENRMDQDAIFGWHGRKDTPGWEGLHHVLHGKEPSKVSLKEMVKKDEEKKES